MNLKTQSFDAFSCLFSANHFIAEFGRSSLPRAERTAHLAVCSGSRG